MKRIIIGLFLVALISAALLLPRLTGISSLPLDAASVHDAVDRLGPVGPLVLIGLMVLAIVVSPIPSGPIAVAAGALYGTMWGGVLSMIGALLGAMAAFGSARYLGYDAVRRSSSPVLRYLTAPRSQTALMGIVFASRLVPFISFDVVSYAAGLTSLSFWQFALATCLGIVPICFALAAVGAGMVGSAETGMTIIMLAGCVTLVPFILRAVWLRVSARTMRRCRIGRRGGWTGRNDADANNARPSRAWFWRSPSRSRKHHQRRMRYWPQS